jgi:hypothetical protein
MAFFREPNQSAEGSFPLCPEAARQRARRSKPALGGAGLIGINNPMWLRRECYMSRATGRVSPLSRSRYLVPRTMPSLELLLQRGSSAVTSSRQHRDTSASSIRGAGWRAHSFAFRVTVARACRPAGRAHYFSQILQLPATDEISSSPDRGKDRAPLRGTSHIPVRFPCGGRGRDIRCGDATLHAFRLNPQGLPNGRRPPLIRRHDSP